MTKKEYKPRLGFDIRVKPPSRGGKPPAWAKPEDRDCEKEGCDNQAACSLPKSPRKPKELIWYCLLHAREHNKNWNFFDGLSDAEAKAERDANQYGGRPTWSMGKNDRARAALNKTGSAEMADAFGVVGNEPKTQAEIRGHYRDGRRLTKMQSNAFNTMALPYGAKSSDIRRRYAELVRRFHPDSNGGDRSAEQQLNEVVKAHTIMKKANFL